MRPPKAQKCCCRTVNANRTVAPLKLRVHRFTSYCSKTYITICLTYFFYWMYKQASCLQFPSLILVWVLNTSLSSLSLKNGLTRRATEYRVGLCLFTSLYWEVFNDSICGLKAIKLQLRDNKPSAQVNKLWAHRVWQTRRAHVGLWWTALLLTRRRFS